MKKTTCLLVTLALLVGIFSTSSAEIFGASYSNHEFKQYTVYINTNTIVPVNEIITNLGNVETVEINKPLAQTSYIGINGGFFAARNGYNNPPTEGSSISFNNGVIHCKNNKGNPRDEHDTSPISKKTLIIYKWRGQYKATYRYIKTLDEAFDIFGKSNVVQVIGGTDYNLSGHEYKGYFGPTGRSVIAWKDNKIHLITIPGKYTGINIPGLKKAITAMGLDPEQSIVLDGSESACMQAKDSYGTWQNIGGYRHIFNAITLKRP